MPLRCDEVEKKHEADGRARVVSAKDVSPNRKLKAL